MKILFQGGWKAGRDPVENKESIIDYCRCLAHHAVESSHSIVLTSNKDFDKIVAEEIVRVAAHRNKNVKDHLIYFWPERKKRCRKKAGSSE